MADPRMLTQLGLHRMTPLVGCRVNNRDGVQVGTIQDLILDLGTNQVATAVIAVPEQAGAPKRHVAVPMVVIGYDPKSRTCTLEIDPQILRKAPTCPLDPWPQDLDHRWVAGVYAHFGFLPYWH